MRGKLPKIILIILSLLVIVFVYFFISDNDKGYEKIKLNWQTDTSSNSWENEEMFKGSITFNWNGQNFVGSNKQFFQLEKDGERLAWLEGDEMRYFKFFDCDQQLCIFGTKLGNHFGTASTPEINLSIFLWPSQKKIVIKSPCESKQVDRFEVEKAEDVRFNLKVNCALVQSYNDPVYRSIIDLKDFNKAQ